MHLIFNNLQCRHGPGSADDDHRHHLDGHE